MQRSIAAALRSNGVVFIASVLAMIALLVIGLGIAGWFTANQAVHEGDAAFAHATTSVGLARFEVCAYEKCISTYTLLLEDSAFGKVGLATLAVGAAFGALVLAFAKKRIADLEVKRPLKWLAYLLGVATIAMSLACMFVFAPSEISYEITTQDGTVIRPGLLHHAYGLTNAPSLGLGGFLTLLGTLLGGMIVWGTRVPARIVDEAEAERAPRPRTSRPQRVTRGPETDPFRAPPAPAPIAVARHERPSTAPVVEDPSDEAPKLLR